LERDVNPAFTETSAGFAAIAFAAGSPVLFNADRRLLTRMAREIERVLVVDPNTASARLIGELMKELGARQPVYATGTERALAVAREFEPQIIFTELDGVGVDGVELTHRLRRSDMPARKAPVVVLATEPREGAIKAARDAGAHEFLVKPFTAGHLFKRVENVTLKPRLWVEAKMYVGPDRRRFNAGEFAGSRKRRADGAQPNKLADAFAAAEIKFRQQMDLYELRPQRALKGMLEMAAELQGTAFHHADPDLASAISSLMGYLTLSVERGILVKPVIEQHLQAIRVLRDQVNRMDGPSRARLLLKLSSAAEANVAA
jgi:two-component system, response regulator PdtaR